MDLMKNVSTIKGLVVHVLIGAPTIFAGRTNSLEMDRSKHPSYCEKNPTPNSQLTGSSLHTLDESVSV